MGILVKIFLTISWAVDIGQMNLSVNMNLLLHVKCEVGMTIVDLAKVLQCRLKLLTGTGVWKITDSFITE